MRPALRVSSASAVQRHARMASSGVVGFPGMTYDPGARTHHPEAIMRIVTHAAAAALAAFVAACHTEQTEPEDRQLAALALAANDQACARRADGVLFCWGVDETGRRPAATTPSRLPADGPRFASLATLGELFGYFSPDETYACGLSPSGEAWCWGAAIGGRLGIGSEADAVVTTPQRVRTELRFRSLALSDVATCGIAFDGAIYCWGRPPGFDGAFEGAPESCVVRSPTGTSEFGCLATPARLRSTERWRQLAASVERDICAIAERDDRLWCLQGGVLFFDYFDAPPSLPGPGPLPIRTPLRFRSIAFTSYGMCGVSTAGTVHCLGRLASLANAAPLEPIPLPAGVRFERVTTGRSHACALSEQGEAWCWGRNDAGQLGEASAVIQTVPVRVLGGLRFTDIRAGSNHTCGVADRRVWCWGDNSQGQLGNGSRVSTPLPTLVAGQEG